MPTSTLSVVFVHGLIGPLANLRISEHLRPAIVLSPDLLGYGAEADADPEDITIEAQVEFLRTSVERATPDARVHLVGHSVGGVIAAAFAHRYPDRVACFVNVEGNFTLADAFWSAQLTGKTPRAVHELLEADRANPMRWLAQMGIEPSPDRIRAAVEALAYQPATTIQATARAVVAYTARPGYDRLLREVFEHTLVHLVAGARSRRGWDVPEWALAAAASYTEIPDAGHMVPLEAADAFGRVLAELIGGRREDRPAVIEDHDEPPTVTGSGSARSSTPA